MTAAAAQFWHNFRLALIPEDMTLLKRLALAERMSSQEILRRALRAYAETALLNERRMSAVEAAAAKAAAEARRRGERRPYERPTDP